MSRIPSDFSYVQEGPTSSHQNKVQSAPQLPESESNFNRLAQLMGEMVKLTREHQKRESELFRLS